MLVDVSLPLPWRGRMEMGFRIPSSLKHGSAEARARTRIRKSPAYRHADFSEFLYALA